MSQNRQPVPDIIITIDSEEVLGMETVRKRVRKKAYVGQNACVACGCCVKVCPIGAIRIEKGVWAQVDMEKCVGCGRCAAECPASVITIREAAV